MLKYKKIQKRFLFFTWEEEIADGWEDIREFTNMYENPSRCSLCRDNLRVGRSNEKAFLYCPTCRTEQRESY